MPSECPQRVERGQCVILTHGTILVVAQLERLQLDRLSR